MGAFYLVLEHIEVVLGVLVVFRVGQWGRLGDVGGRAGDVMRLRVRRGRVRRVGEDALAHRGGEGEASVGCARQGSWAGWLLVVDGCGRGDPADTERRAEGGWKSARHAGEHCRGASNEEAVVGDCVGRKVEEKGRKRLEEGRAAVE